MFADSFCEVSGKDRVRRTWTTLASFTAQVFGSGLLLLLPLLYTQDLPQLQQMAALVAPSPPPAAPPNEAVRQKQCFESNISSDGRVIAPPSVPTEVAEISESAPPPPVDVSGLSVPGGTGVSGTNNAVLNSIGSGLSSIAPPPPAPVVHHPRVSQMMEGNLVYRVQPQYSPLARQARIQGIVVLHAIIDREGRITHLEAVNGHPMLVRAAIDAVQQWRYRPYYLNGEPVEVETSITVNFKLMGG